jgi:phosphoribosylcarboxyaminoimidazole (NCAIR) mutase
VILALSDPRLRQRLHEQRRRMAADVRSKSKGLDRKLKELLKSS